MNSYVVSWQGNPYFGDMPPITPGTEQTLEFDFSQGLDPGVVLEGTPTVDIAVVVGTDAEADERLIGDATIGTVTANLCAARQVVGTMLDAVKYLVTVSCSLSNGDTIEGYTHINCTAPS